MYREEQWEKGLYIVNLQKYHCNDCRREFIVGKELLKELEEGLPGFPICPYCGKENNTELTVWTDDDQLQELASELGCLAIYMNKEDIQEADESDIIGHVEKTGHLYKRLHMEDIESVDNCAACDEACCDMCIDVYIVEDWKENKLLYKGRDKEKAIKIAGYDFT